MRFLRRVWNAAVEVFADMFTPPTDYHDRSERREGRDG